MRLCGGGCSSAVQPRVCHCVLAWLRVPFAFAGSGAGTAGVRFLNQLNSQLNGDALACVWKAAGILVLTQAEQDVCREAGHAALAGRVEMLGRLAALAAALPLVRQFAALTAGLLG